MGPDANGRPLASADGQRLFEDAPAPYLVTDSGARILRANRAAAELLRTPREELAGASLWDLLPGSGRERAEHRLRALGGGEAQGEWEGELLLDSGETLPVYFRVGRVEAAEAYQVGWLIRELSVTEQAHRALSESEARLRTLNTLKDTFLRSVSHDLRGPLAAVIGLAQTLARPDLHLEQADADDLLQRLLGSANQMKSLLTDLLDLDRLTEGYTGTMSERVDLDELGRQVFGQFGASRGLRLELVGSGLVATTDRAVLERIVVNLVENAVRYTAPGGKVWLRFEAVGAGDLVLSVDDEGPGVDEAAKRAIFEPFVRGSSSPNDSGTGVGLALVDRFAGLLGGRAWVEDRTGGGASFKVVLPRCLEAHPPTD